MEQKEADAVFTLPEGSFSESLAALQSLLAEQQKLAKEAESRATRADKRAARALWEERLAELEGMILTAKEAQWLFEKFGNGEYKDIPGLCRAAGLAEIEEKGWSLTPGAYVGVAPVEDDGVDFAQRMNEIHAELVKLQAESNALMETISQNWKEMRI